MAQLETGDALAGASDNDLLAGDRFEIFHGGFDDLDIGGAFALADIDGHLFDRWNFHHIRQTELLVEFLANAFVHFLKARGRTLFFATFIFHDFFGLVGLVFGWLVAGRLFRLGLFVALRFLGLLFGHDQPRGLRPRLRSSPLPVGSDEC